MSLEGEEGEGTLSFQTAGETGDDIGYALLRWIPRTDPVAGRQQRPGQGTAPCESPRDQNVAYTNVSLGVFSRTLVASRPNQGVKKSKLNQPTKGLKRKLRVVGFVTS